jgi:hypothetical protein
VVVSIVHISKGTVPRERVLDGKRVGTITPFLFAYGTTDEPARLQENQFSYIGCDIKGQGFLFDDGDPDANPVSTMEAIVARDPSCADRIRPYMSGEDLNNAPTLSAKRFVIDFDDLELEEAERWPDLLELVRTKVLPERLSKPKELARWPWWRFWRTRKEMREAIKGFSRMIVTAQTGNAQAFAFIATSVIPSHSVVVVARDSYAMFAVLQSQVHQHWAAFMGPSLKDDRRYAPSDCFETFPFPKDIELRPDLRERGQTYYEYRADLMLRRNIGLTATYNRFHDPDDLSEETTTLRALHGAIDRAVLDAYGWSYIRPTCEFLLDYEDDVDEMPGKSLGKRKPWRYRWPDDVRDEVLGRLLALNARRAAEEQPRTPSRTPASQTPKRRRLRKDVGSLLD